jgi:hypothetical protein
MGNNNVVVLLVLVKICHIMTQRGFMLYTTIHTQTFDPSFEFTTTCAIVAYHHLCCEFEPHAWRGVLDKTLCDESFSVTCDRSLVSSINENNWFAESKFF